MNLNERFTAFLERNISKHTRDKYYYRLRPFIERYGQRQPESVTAEMIADYISSKPQLSEASKAILKSCFHAFLNFCNVSPNPAAMLPNWRDTPKRVIIPAEKDIATLLNQAIVLSLSGSPREKRDSLILSLSVMSGNRRGELRALTLPEVQDALQHPENGVFHAETSGKAGTAVIRFTSFHAPFIERYTAVRPQTSCQHYFVNLNPNHKRYGQQLSLVGFDRARYHICKRANVPTITYQELRRRLATMIARREGVDIAAHALGHSPHSGDRVIRAFYYDPDKAAVDAACLAVFPGD